MIPEGDMNSNPESWASDQKQQLEEAQESRVARERERLAWEEAERQKKVQERLEAERQRLEAERRALYAELESLDYDLLSLKDFPTDHELYVAKRSRTLWFTVLGSALFLFLASLLSLTSAWVGGIAGGLAFVLWLSHGAGMISFFPSLNRYSSLMNQRHRLKKDLIEYIRNLEGRLGFMHRIYPLTEYNSRMSTRKFKRLALMSKEHTLLANLRTLQDTQAYHEFMVEALKAYKEMLQREKEDKFVKELDLSAENLGAEEIPADTEQQESAEKTEVAEAKAEDSVDAAATQATQTEQEELENQKLEKQEPQELQKQKEAQVLFAPKD